MIRRLSMGLSKYLGMPKLAHSRKNATKARPGPARQGRVRQGRRSDRAKMSASAMRELFKNARLRRRKRPANEARPAAPSEPVQEPIKKPMPEPTQAQDPVKEPIVQEQTQNVAPPAEPSTTPSTNSSEQASLQEPKPSIFETELAATEEKAASFDPLKQEAGKEFAAVMESFHKLEMQSTESYMLGDISEAEFQQTIDRIKSGRETAMQKKEVMGTGKEISDLTSDITKEVDKIDPWQSTNSAYYLDKVEVQKKRLDDLEASVHAKIDSGEISEDYAAQLQQELDDTRANVMKKADNVALHAFYQSTEYLSSGIEKGSYAWSTQQIKATEKEMQSIYDRGLMTDKQLKSVNASLGRYQKRLSSAAEKDINEHIQKVQDHVYKADGNLYQTLSHLNHAEKSWGYDKANKMIEDMQAIGAISEDKATELGKKVDRVKQSANRTAYWAFRREIYNNIGGDLNKKQDESSLRRNELRLQSVSNVLETYAPGHFSQEQIDSINKLISQQSYRIQSQREYMASSS